MQGLDRQMEEYNRPSGRFLCGPSFVTAGSRIGVAMPTTGLLWFPGAMIAPKLSCDPPSSSSLIEFHFCSFLEYLSLKDLCVYAFLSHSTAVSI